MTRTQLYLPQTQYEELKHLAIKEGKSFAALVRELLDEKVSEKKLIKKRKLSPINQWLKSLRKIQKYKEPGVVRYGSTRHDEILYGKKPL